MKTVTTGSRGWLTTLSGRSPTGSSTGRQSLFSCKSLSNSPCCFVNKSGICSGCFPGVRECWAESGVVTQAVKPELPWRSSCRAWRPEMKLSSTPVVGVEGHDAIDARCSTRFSLKSIAGLFNFSKARAFRVLHHTLKEDNRWRFAVH